MNKMFRNSEELMNTVGESLSQMYDDIVSKVGELLNTYNEEELSSILNEDIQYLYDIVEGNLSLENMSSVFVTKILAMFGMTTCIVPLMGMQGMGMPPIGMGRQMNRQTGRPIGEINHPIGRPMGRPMIPNGEKPNHEVPTPNMEHPNMPNERFGRMGENRKTKQTRMPNGRFGRCIPVDEGEMIGDMPLPIKRNNPIAHTESRIDPTMSNESRHDTNVDISSMILDAIHNNPSLKESLKTMLNS